MIKQADIQINKCVLWDPIDSGEALIRQLTRIKIANAMAGDMKKITTQEVLDGIEQSGFLEVSGYHVSSGLIDAVKSLKISDSIESALVSTDLHWMTTGMSSSNSNQQLPICLTKLNLAESLLAQLTMHSVTDVRFWMQQEVTIAPQLLRETKQILVS